MFLPFCHALFRRVQIYWNNHDRLGKAYRLTFPSRLQVLTFVPESEIVICQDWMPPESPQRERYSFIFNYFAWLIKLYFSINFDFYLIKFYVKKFYLKIFYLFFFYLFDDKLGFLSRMPFYLMIQPPGFT